MLGRIFRVLRVLLLPYLVVLLGLMAFENSLLFFPRKYPDGNWNPPGLQFEDAYFVASDGTKLHGWYVPHEHPRAAVLYSHGNGGNVTHRAEILKQLHDRVGVSVLIFDYRGYGRSEGSPNEAGILADARAARAWLANRAQILESQIVLMGESLGGGVAVDLAARDGARGLILDSTFSSLPDAAAVHYPWVPVKLLMRSQLDSRAKIPDYHGPLLQSHGSADTIIPIELGRRLFEAANEPKQFVVIQGGNHNDLRNDLLYQAIDEFLNRLNDEDEERKPTRP